MSSIMRWRDGKQTSAWTIPFRSAATPRASLPGVRRTARKASAAPAATARGSASPR